MNDDILLAAIDRFNDGHHASAAPLLRRYLALTPRSGEAFHYLGLAEHFAEGGNFTLPFLRRALWIGGDVARICNSLGGYWRDRGQASAAEFWLARALRMAPDLADANYNMGSVLLDRPDPGCAIPFIQKSLISAPHHVAAWNNLGIAYKRLGDVRHAARSFVAALACNPRSVATLNNYGNLLAAAGRHAEARAHFEVALHAAPEFAETHFNLGNLLKSLGDIVASRRAYKGAIRLRPSYADAHCNLGNAEFADRDAWPALRSYRRAQALNPNLADAHWNESLTLLFLGRFRAGWRKYEWRWRLPAVPSRDFGRPWWRGQDIAGRKLLVHAEQGFGDTLHFVRFILLAARRGAEVFFEVQPPLFRLLASSRWPMTVIPQGLPLPQTEYHCPLMSLPHVLQATQPTAPPLTMCLVPDRRSVRAYGRRAGHMRPRIGVVWAGDAKVDRRRSLDRSSLAQLVAKDAFEWISLQVGPRAADAVDLPLSQPGSGSAALGDFEDTAAVVAHLDLVITIDTSVAHLAAGMARPTWVLVSQTPDWRWPDGRDDNSSYPTLRVFRQAKLDHWTPVIQRLHRVLDRYFAEPQE